MITFFIRHGVTDFDTWKSSVAAAMESTPPETLQEMGMVETKFHRQVDGSGVIVVHKFKDLEAARKHKNMLEAAETQAHLEQTGVILPMTIWLAEEL